MTIQKLRTFLKTRKGLLTAIALVLVLGLTAIGMTSHSVKKASAEVSFEYDFKVTVNIVARDSRGYRTRNTIPVRVYTYGDADGVKGIEVTANPALYPLVTKWYAKIKLTPEGRWQEVLGELENDYIKFSFKGGELLGFYNGSASESSIIKKFRDNLSLEECIGDVSAAAQPLPDPVKEGHTFVNWYYDAEFTQQYDGAPITEDTELFAKFQVNRYRVTLDGLYDETIGIFYSTAWNTVFTDFPPVERTGYNFLGWYIGDTEYTDQPIKSDTTIVAKWEIKTFKVTFYVDGEVYNEMIVEYGTILKAALEEATFKPAAFYKVYNSAGEPMSITDEIVDEVNELTVVAKTGWEKFIAWMSVYWWIPVAGLGALIVLGVVFGSKRR